MSKIPEIALKISGKHGIHKTIFKDGDTQDIINTVIWADSQKEHKSDTGYLAAKLKGATPLQTAYNTWYWVKNNIKYILDPLGEQYIKAPNKTLIDGFGDCKSRTLLITSLLANNGIAYGYRFAGYHKNKPLGHVYALIYINGVVHVLDPDMNHFNVQKEFVKHQDHKIMSSIAYIAGVGANPLRTKEYKEAFKAFKANLKKQNDEELAAFNAQPNKTRAYSSRWAENRKYRNINQIKMFKRKFGIVSGIEEEGVFGLYLPANKMTDGDMEIAIRKQRDEINARILEGRSGVGCPDKSTHTSRIRDRLEAFNDVIQVRKSALSGAEQMEEIGAIADDFIIGAYNNDDIAGLGNSEIGRRSRRERREQRQQKRAQRREKRKARLQRIKSRVKNVTGKLKQGIKKFAKLALKVATFPQRMFVKGLLEVTLPKAAPFFIYLFVTKPELINKLPSKAAKKRRLALKIRNFIVNTIGMKEAHFMGIVRNGIMKRYKKSPETVLSQWLGFNVSGINALPLALIPILIKVIKKLAVLFKKKGEGEELEKEMNEAEQEGGEGGASPDPKADFAEQTETERKEFANEVKRQEVQPEERSLDSESTAKGGFAANAESSNAEGSSSEGSEGSSSEGSSSNGSRAKQFTTPGEEPTNVGSRNNKLC